MSLYYIDDSEPEQRRIVADELLSSGRIVVEGEDRIILNCFDDKLSTVGNSKLSGFDGEEVWVVRCEGPVKQWEVLEKVVLPHL
jgi:hypothetical protein